MNGYDDRISRFDALARIIGDGQKGQVAGHCNESGMEQVLVVANRFLDLVAMIPGTFWGVVVGALFSLGGVVATNRATARRLEHQFTHDRQLRKEERDFALRRDIYIDATEAFVRCAASFERLMDLSIPADKVGEVFVEKIPVISKMHVIGEQAVVTVGAELAVEIGVLFQELLVKRVPLDTARGSIRNLDAQIEQAQVQKTKILDMMMSHNLEQAPDPRRFAVLQGNFDFHQRIGQEANSQRQEAWQKLIALQVSFGRDCMDAISKVNGLSAQLLLAMRGELGYPFDDRAYMAIVSRAHARTSATLDQTLKDIQDIPLAGMSDGKPGHVATN